MHVAIIGGGPAGLRAAEVAAGAGARVTLYEAKPSVGRKFLVAGRGGLNLTHGEDLSRFVTRYSGPNQPPDFWPRTLAAFSPADLRAWASGLGIETFQQRTGRIYPLEMKAAPLLRRWVERLRSLGVAFATNHRWTGLAPGTPHALTFDHHGGTRTLHADAAVFALGGASWPITGSDGRWTSLFENLGIRIAPLQPANCGWETPWSASILAIAEGRPLKNLHLRAGGEEARGELMVTTYGLEGGALYQLGPALRAMPRPSIEIDFKPTATPTDLLRKMESVRHGHLQACLRRWKLSEAAHAILCHGLPQDIPLPSLAARAKACPIAFTRPRPIDEAISTTGGVPWDELDETLMLRKIPGIFLAGEMIDWEAPTGGYLMQGCFATGTLAGRSAARWNL